MEKHLNLIVEKPWLDGTNNKELINMLVSEDKKLTEKKSSLIKILKELLSKVLSKMSLPEKIKSVPLLKKENLPIDMLKNIIKNTVDTVILNY